MAESEVWSCTNSGFHSEGSCEEDEEDGGSSDEDDGGSEMESTTDSDVSLSDNTVFSEDEQCSGVEEEEEEEEDWEEIESICDSDMSHNDFDSSDEYTSDEADDGDYESDDEEDNCGDSEDYEDETEQTATEEGTVKICLPLIKTSPCIVSHHTTSAGGAATPQSDDSPAEEDLSDETEGEVTIDADSEFCPIHPATPTTVVTAPPASSESELQCWEYMLESAVQQCKGQDTTTLSRTSSEEELTSIFGNVHSPTPIRPPPSTAEASIPTQDNPAPQSAGGGWTQDSYRESLKRWWEHQTLVQQQNGPQVPTATSTQAQPELGLHTERVDDCSTGSHHVAYIPQTQSHCSTASETAFTAADVHTQIFMGFGRHFDLGPQHVSAPPAREAFPGTFSSQPECGNTFKGTHHAYSTGQNGLRSVYPTQGMAAHHYSGQHFAHGHQYHCPHAVQAFSNQPSCGHFHSSGLSPDHSTGPVRDHAHYHYCSRGDTFVTEPMVAPPTTESLGFGYSPATAAPPPLSHTVSATPATGVQQTPQPPATQTPSYLSNALFSSSLDLPTPPSAGTYGTLTASQHTSATHTAAPGSASSYPEPPPAQLTPRSSHSGNKPAPLIISNLSQGDIESTPPPPPPPGPSTAEQRWADYAANRSTSPEYFFYPPFTPEQEQWIVQVGHPFKDYVLQTCQDKVHSSMQQSMSDLID